MSFSNNTMNTLLPSKPYVADQQQGSQFGKKHNSQNVYISHVKKGPYLT